MLIETSLLVLLLGWGWGWEGVKQSVTVNDKAERIVVVTTLRNKNTFTTTDADVFSRKKHELRRGALSEQFTL